MLVFSETEFLGHGCKDRPMKNMCYMGLYSAAFFWLKPRNELFIYRMNLQFSLNVSFFSYLESRSIQFKPIEIDGVEFSLSSPIAVVIYWSV